MKLRKIMKKMNTFRGGVNITLIVYIIVFMLNKETWFGFLVTFIVYNLTTVLANLLNRVITQKSTTPKKAGHNSR